MVGLKIKEYLDAKGIKYSYLAEKTGRGRLMKELLIQVM